MSSLPEIPFLQSHTLPDGVEQWADVVRAQQQTIQAQQQTIEALEKRLQQQQERIEQLEAEVRAQKEAEGETQAGCQSAERRPPGL